MSYPGSASIDSPSPGVTRIGNGDLARGVLGDPRPGREGAGRGWPPRHLHCAACSRARRHCRRGPRWRSFSRAWWWWSGSWRRMSPLSSLLTGGRAGGGGGATNVKCVFRTTDLKKKKERKKLSLKSKLASGPHESKKDSPGAASRKSLGRRGLQPCGPAPPIQPAVLPRGIRDGPKAHATPLS